MSYKQIYRAFLEGEGGDPICHVEHYMNRNDFRWSPKKVVESGRRFELNPNTDFEMTTSDSVGIPYVPYSLFNKDKKKAVNIDLIVLKVSSVSISLLAFNH